MTKRGEVVHDTMTSRFRFPAALSTAWVTILAYRGRKRLQGGVKEGEDDLHASSQEGSLHACDVRCHERIEADGNGLSRLFGARKRPELVQ